MSGRSQGMEVTPMGDLSAEPSMEEILSSIKRIIAEEGDATPARQRRQQRIAPAVTPPPVADEQGDADEVLELKDAVPQKPAMPEPEHAPVQPAMQAEPAPAPQPAPPPVAEDAPVAQPILSRQAAESTRGSLEALSRMLVKPEPESDGTLEGLVREMLRPMLREWLDTHLPEMVQAMVAREIAKITGMPGMG
jgi:cell pole-organizing protein PopZ